MAVVGESKGLKGGKEKKMAVIDQYATVDQGLAVLELFHAKSATRFKRVASYWHDKA